MKRPRIMICAGETSGDRLGAGLARALLQRRPELELVGMGGEQMEQAGVERVQDAAEVAVMGIVEVLEHLPAIRRAMSRLERSIAERPPDLLVPVDFPDFNLRLAERAARAGVPIAYFVSPQVWAWRKGRVRQIRRLVRRMLVLFPFEVEFYRDADVPVTFVGHPLLARDESPDPALGERVGLDPGRRTVALLPGSRAMEVRRHLPIMLRAAEILQREEPELQFLVSQAPGFSLEEIRRELSQVRLRHVVVHSGDFPRVLQQCEVGVVVSGTASLEAAVSGLPVVIVYRMSPLSYLVGRALVRLDHFALPNLVAGRRILPELAQKDCTPERIAALLQDWLNDPERRRRVRKELDDLSRSLDSRTAFDRAAEAVLGELDSLGAERD